jgi:hypothetical protein
MPPTSNPDLGAPVSAPASQAQSIRLEHSSCAPSRTTMVLMVVLLAHAGLMLGDALPGPAWASAIEAVLALGIGLARLRHITAEDEAG